MNVIIKNSRFWEGDLKITDEAYERFVYGREKNQSFGAKKQ